MALCPSHADKNPSLHITLVGEPGNRYFLICCQAGCQDFRKILIDAGLSPNDLYEPPKCSVATNHGNVEAEYIYTDEDGQPLYKKVRYTGKRFAQFQPDGQGGWKPGISGVHKVLYDLPKLLDADRVFYVEGEKDVHNAEARGLVATTKGSSREPWFPDFSEALPGKHIIIIPDADKPGREDAQRIAAAVQSIATSLKVLELPGAKDLSEWFERGGTLELLEELISNAPEWKPTGERSQTAQNGFRLASLRDLMLEPEEHVSWLLANKLPTGGLSVLSAKPKVGKSTFARCLSLAVATGESFLDCATTKGPVIYLALKEKRGEVRRHFVDLGATGDEEIHIHAASAPRDAMLELYELTKQFHPTLIVIDPLFKFVRIRDEKAYSEVCNALEPLLTLARESGAHVLLTHHSGKMERADATDGILGSTAIFGGVDSAIILKKSDRYRTVLSSQRYGTDWAETVLNFDASERSLSLGVQRSEAEAGRIGEAIVTYLASCDELQTRVQIESHIEGRTKHKRTALKVLCEDGRVSESGAGAKGDPLRYGLNSSLNQTANDPKTCVDSCSHVYTGTREQQSENGTEPRINASDIVVPDVSRGIGNEDTSEETSEDLAFLEGKL